MKQSNPAAAQHLINIGKHLRFISFGYLSLIALPSYFCLDLLSYCLTSSRQWWHCQQLWDKVLHSASVDPIQDFIDPIGLALMMSLCLPQQMILAMMWSFMTSLFLIAEVMSQQQILAYNPFGHR